MRKVKQYREIILKEERTASEWTIEEYSKPFFLKQIVLDDLPSLEEVEKLNH